MRLYISATGIIKTLQGQFFVNIRYWLDITCSYIAHSKGRHQRAAFII